MNLNFSTTSHATKEEEGRKREQRGGRERERKEARERGRAGGREGGRKESGDGKSRRIGNLGRKCVCEVKTMQLEREKEQINK